MGVKKIFGKTVEAVINFWEYKNRKSLKEGKQQEGKQQKSTEEEFKKEVIIAAEEKKKKMLRNKTVNRSPNTKIYKLSSKEIYERQKDSKRKKDLLQQSYVLKKEEVERINRAKEKRLKRINKFNNTTYYMLSTKQQHSLKQTRETHTQEVVKNVDSSKKDEIKEIKTPTTKKNEKILQYDEKFRRKFQEMQNAYGKSNIYRVIDGGKSTKKEKKFKDNYKFAVQPPKDNHNNIIKNETDISSTIKKGGDKCIEHDFKNFSDFN